MRTVALANGQVASLILEEGRLQRIVSSNGQIAELRWQPPTAPTGGRQARQLSVKMHRGVSPPRKAQSHASMILPGGLKRWANSLNSQRLTTGPLSTGHSQDLATSPARPGVKSRSSQETRGTKSIDMSRPAKEGKRRGFVQSLFSMPTHAQVDKNASRDMQTILDTQNREGKGEWNPMGSSWLPNHMTTNESGDLIPEAAANLERRKRTQSVDAGVLAKSRPRLYTGGGQLPAISSPPESPMQRPPKNQTLNPATFDSYQGDLREKAKKKGMWTSLKRALHIPKFGKSAAPQSTPENPGGMAKSRSFNKRMGVRFSLDPTSKADKDVSTANQLPYKPDALSRGKTQSASNVNPTSSFGKQPAGTSAKTRSRSTSDFATKGMGMNVGKMADSLAGPETAEMNTIIPPQQGIRQNLDSRLSSAEYPSSDFQDLRTSRIEEDAEFGGGRPSSDFEPRKSEIPQYSEWMGGQSGEQEAVRGQLQDSGIPIPARSFGLTTGGSLVDTTELKAAFNNRKPSGLQTQASDFGPADIPKSGVGWRQSGEVQQLSGGKQRTLMAGKWQKNFTEGTSGSKVDDLLHVSSLQRLARERIVEMQIVETEDTFELVWHIPLNGSASKISKTDRYLKNGEVVEAARRDGRPGLLRSQLTFTPEGHVHIRALQGEPYSAVFHDRIKLSSGGRRIKFEQKFQLLQPGVAPVKYYSIWHRIE